MNPATLLAHFERVAEAPDAVPRLRRFILDLAVRGKLAEQDPNDAPVFELLRSIQAQRERLVRDGTIKKQEPLPAVDAENAPFAVPKHWAWLRLSETGLLSGGMTPSKNRQDFWGGNINWFSPKDIKSDELVDSELKITSAGVAETGLQLYPPGCLFMVARSGILKRTFPVSINRVEATANQDLKVLRPFVKGLERYLQIMFRGMTELILSVLVKTGTTVQSLKYEQFESQPLPLPPLAEQHRIVATVDELMALCDELEAAQAKREKRRDRLVAATLHGLNNGDASPEAGTRPAFEESARFTFHHLSRLTTRAEHIHQLRQTILSLAVRGRLVEQNSSDEPASILHQRLTAEAKSYASRNGLAPVRLQAVVNEAIPWPAPSGWIWTRLSALFNVITDGDHQPPPKSEDGVAFLTIGNITTGRLDFSNCRFVPQEYFDGLAPYRKPTCGDILYTVVGATYGRPAPVDTHRSFCVQRHIAILKPASEVDATFVCWLLASPLVYEQATRSTTGTAQPTVPLRPLRNFLIPLPPLAEQHRIVAKVNDLMALCDALEAQLTTTAATSRQLLEAAINEALNTPRGIDYDAHR